MEAILVVAALFAVLIGIYRHVIAPSAEKICFRKGNWLKISGDNLVLHLSEKNQELSINKRQLLVASEISKDKEIRHFSAMSHTTTTGYIGPSGIVTGSSSTIHSPGGSYEKVVGETASVMFGAMTEEETYRRLLFTRCPDNVIPSPPYDDTYYYPTYHIVECHPSKLPILRRWMINHGIPQPPDESAAEAKFKLEIQAKLDQLRNQYGCASDELDVMGFSTIDFTVVYYARLAADALSIFVYMADKNITWNSDLTVSGIFLSKIEGSKKISDWYMSVDHPIYGQRGEIIRLSVAQGMRYASMEARRKESWEAKMRNEHNVQVGGIKQKPPSVG